MCMIYPVLIGVPNHDRHSPPVKATAAAAVLRSLDRCLADDLFAGTPIRNSCAALQPYGTVGVAAARDCF